MGGKSVEKRNNRRSRYRSRRRREVRPTSTSQINLEPSSSGDPNEPGKKRSQKKKVQVVHVGDADIGAEITEIGEKQVKPTEPEGRNSTSEQEEPIVDLTNSDEVIIIDDSNADDNTSRNGSSSETSPNPKKPRMNENSI